MRPFRLTGLFVAACVTAGHADTNPVAAAWAHPAVARRARPKVLVPQDLRCTPGHGMVTNYKRDGKGNVGFGEEEGARAPVRLKKRSGRSPSFSSWLPRNTQVRRSKHAVGSSR